MTVDSIEPFCIDIPDADVSDLQRRLLDARWPGATPDMRPGEGIMPEPMRRLVARWTSDFNWRTAQTQLNQLPQILTEIAGQRLHAVHRRSPRADAIPLLLLHGWPSTFAEFRHIIDDLAEPGDPGVPAFHVVVPSLPGFGFSTPVREHGWGAARIAQALAELMHRLGYPRYLAHGTDAGYQVAAAIGRVDEAHVAGIHLNLGGVGLAGLHRDQPPRDDQERQALLRYTDYVRDKSAYALLNATRPQTVAYALTDSPVGQLAWIAEKYFDWSDPQSHIPDDDVLIAASIYWFTRTALSSARFYQEEYTANRPDRAQGRTFVRVPTAVSSFPYEIVPPVRRWAAEQYNIVRWTDMIAAGHFSALERPDLIIEALRGFAGQLEAG